MSSVSRVFASVVKAGRIRHAFALSVAVGVLVISTVTAAAYFGATGTGTIANVQAGSANATVTFATSGVSTYVYKDSTGAAAANLPLGGSVGVPLTVTCTSNPPCTLSSITLTGWSADAGHAGCTSTAFPGSFTISGIAPALPQTIAALNGTATITPTIVWNNLASLNQGPCAGATFTFNISTP